MLAPPPRRTPAVVILAVTAVIAGLATTACAPTVASAPPGTIAAVGAESEYANVISQVGGRYVHVTAVESNPNTDPHSFESSAAVSDEVAGAKLIVQNGVGYDEFMTKIESASPSSARKVITVQKLLGLPDSTPNPHLWYSPTTMPAVARALVRDLSALQPAHAAYFRANGAAFVSSLQPWLQAIAHFKATDGGTPVATTEPVGDYMLQAIGTDNLTPFGLQADIMNGTDPAPEDVTLQDGFFRNRKVKVFVYNQQVTDSLTDSFLKAAQHDHIPVVGVYETMPTPGYNYQSWMLAEVQAMQRAVDEGISTQKL